MLYQGLVANAVIDQNVVDMNRILHELRREGMVVKREDVATLSPYLRQAADWGTALANTSHSASVAEQPPQVLSVTPSVRSRMDKSKWRLALHEGGVPASQWASPRFVMVS